MQTDGGVLLHVQYARHVVSHLWQAHPCPHTSPPGCNSHVKTESRGQGSLLFHMTARPCCVMHTVCAYTKHLQCMHVRECPAHLVDQPHLLCLLCVIQAGQEPHLTRLLLPYQACHVGGAIPGVKAAHLGACLPKHCVVCCNLHAPRTQGHAQHPQ